MLFRFSVVVVAHFIIDEARTCFKKCIEERKERAADEAKKKSAVTKQDQNLERK